MDGDDETKDEDPVVREIDVVLADWGDPTDDAPRPGLALLQYPIRARERGPEPFDAARIKVRHELLEVDVPATKSGPHVDERAPERMRFDKRTLAATTVAPETNYAVGALRGGILRIAPLATTYQMRPSFAYVDAADEADHVKVVLKDVKVKDCRVNGPRVELVVKDTIHASILKAQLESGTIRASNVKGGALFLKSARGNKQNMISFYRAVLSADSATFD